MTANKMPEMPEAALLTHRGTEGWTREQVEADRRACYLAGIAAARECVPGAFTQIDYIKHRVSADEAAGHNHCRTTTLTNLTALVKEAQK